jgi:predicted nucleic acid-binding protein
MAAEVFIDTSGFYAQWDRNDPAHQRAKTWLQANRGKFVAVTTEWVIGETCTLLMARGVPHFDWPLSRSTRCQQGTALDQSRCGNTG